MLNYLGQKKIKETKKKKVKKKKEKNIEKRKKIKKTNFFFLVIRQITNTRIIQENVAQIN